jgi:hypothetical protein
MLVNHFIVRLAQLFNPSDTKIPQINNPGSNQLQIVLNFFFGLIGVVAVLIISIAGLQYVLSNGDPQKAAKAKDAILYAVVGLVLAIAGVGIVNLVVSKVG